MSERSHEYAISMRKVRFFLQLIFDISETSNEACYYCRDRMPQGCGVRAYMDVFTASLDSNSRLHPPREFPLIPRGCRKRSSCVPWPCRLKRLLLVKMCSGRFLLLQNPHTVHLVHKCSFTTCKLHFCAHFRLARKHNPTF